MFSDEEKKQADAHTAIMLRNLAGDIDHGEVQVVEAYYESEMETHEVGDLGETQLPTGLMRYTVTFIDKPETSNEDS